MTEASVANQIRLSMLELNSQILQNNANTIANLNTKKSKTNTVANALTSTNSFIYATKGDSKYKEEIDTNSDNIITFNEYVKYINEQNFSNTNSAIQNLARFTKTEDSDSGVETITIQNLGKAIRNYTNNYLTLPESLINTEV